MKTNRTILISFILAVSLLSCLVPPAPAYHYFAAADPVEKNIPTVKIFSTPRYKNYIVSNVDSATQVFIKSPVFDDPAEFHLMINQSFFENKAKQYQLDRKDRKFYRTDDYKNITLKIISGGIEKMISYKISGKE